MRRGRPPYPDLLTPREQEVLSLIREGLTNEQIAQRLDISESGARYHVSEILSKLGVESRYEAAQWRGDDLVQAPAGVPILAGLGRWVTGGRRLVLGLGVLAAAALAVLSLGVAVNELRGSAEDEQALGPTPTPGPEVLRMHELAGEAADLADVIAPDADLYRLLYWRGGDTEAYHFHFARSDGTEVYINRITMPDQASWTFITGNLDEAVSSPLDLADVVHSPQDVSTAATVASALPSVDECEDICQLLALETGPSGPATWDIQSARDITSEWVPCELEDGNSLQAMTCGSVIPSPVWPGSAPATPPMAEHLTTAHAIREMAELGLKLARIYEPESFLFSLRGLTNIGNIPTSFWLGFSDPAGSRVTTLFYQSGSSWELHLPQPSGVDEALPALDLTSLQRSVDDIAGLVDHDDEIFLARPNVTLSEEDGRLVWLIEGTNGGGQVLCTLPADAPDSELACEDEGLAPTPGP